MLVPPSADVSAAPAIRALAVPLQIIAASAVAAATPAAPVVIPWIGHIATTVTDSGIFRGLATSAVWTADARRLSSVSLSVLDPIIDE